MDGMHVFLLITILALIVFIIGLVVGIRMMRSNNRMPPYW
jgi:hypothetical protein